jgi:hypothetical protein
MVEKYIKKCRIEKQQDVVVKTRKRSARETSIAMKADI